MSPILALVALVVIAGLLWRIAKFVAKIILVVVVALAVYFFLFGEEADAKTLVESPVIVTTISAA